MNKKGTTSHFIQRLMLFALFAHPLSALADRVTVADANGNELTYSFEGADGPATFTGINAYSADEAKAGRIIIADAVTDGDGNSHPVLYVSGSVSNRSDLRSIVFGKNIVSTGGADGEQNDAFYNCQKLESVILNAKLETLGRYTFQNCYYLRHVNLSEATSLKTIKYSAFMDCDRMEPLTLPASVSTLEERAFWGLDSLTAFTFAPGSQLTAIPANCFYDCSSIQSITLPDGVQTVGSGAFYSCEELTEINFGTGLQTIANDYYLFYGDNKLRKLVLPGDIYPFTGSIWLPANVMLFVHPDLVDTYLTTDYTKNYQVIAIGSTIDFSVTTTAGGQLQAKVEALGQAANLLSLTVSGPLNGTDIDYIHRTMPNIEVLNLTAASIVPGGDSYHQWNVAANGTATIETYYGPWNTEKDVISRCMFYNMPTLRSLSLPAGAKAIGEWACAQDRNQTLRLQHIDLPAGVDSIARNAFQWAGITEVTVPVGVKRLEQETFWNCRNLKRVTLPDGITYIGPSCFSECRKLQQVNMPASVETIDDYAFYDNYERTTPLVLPASLKTIGQSAFAYNYVLPSVTFSDGLTSVGPYAFRDCRIIEQARLPESVTMVGQNVFYNCDSLRTFTFPQNIKEVPWGFLESCDALTSVTLADGTTSIASYAFNNCPRLASINIDQPTLTSLGDYVFQNTAFTTFTLPNSVTSAASCIFQRCAQLTSVNVPTGLDYVPYDYCYECPKLTSVQMHNGIRTVRHNAFVRCKLLPTIELNDQITSIEYRAFEGCEALVLDRLPAALTFIGDAAFSNCKAITGTLTVPDGVTQIDNSAFAATAITAAVLPDGLTKMGTDLFYDCDKLVSVKLPATLTRLPNYTFQRAKALRTISLPATVREIGYAAFDDSGLESITLPDSLRLIETYALAGTQLRTIRIPDATETVQWGFAQSCKRLKSAYLGRNMNYAYINDFNYFNGCDSLQLLRIYAGTPPAISEYYSSAYRANCVLEVPEDQVELYRQTNVWKDFKEIRGFFMGDVLNDLDYAVLCKLYREADGQNWKSTHWDLTNDHHATGKWPGVTTATKGSATSSYGQTYYITAIDLHQQELDGQLPDSLFLLPQLQTLNLSDNRLTGDLATVASGFATDTPSTLTELNLSGNRLTGDLYPLAAQLTALKTLDVSYNQLTDISEPLSATITSFNADFQFVDLPTHQVVSPLPADAPVTDITAGVATDIPMSSLYTYNHSARNYGYSPSGLARCYYTNSWTYDWELTRDSEGLWNLYADNGNYVLRARKDEVTIFTGNGSWRTLLLRFTWDDGDVNADQTVDVSDLQSVIYYALRDRKPESQMFNFTTADVNSDQAINVSDVIGSVDYVLGYSLTTNPSPKERGVYSSSADNTNHSPLLGRWVGGEAFLGFNGNTVTLTTSAEVAALQLTITGCSKSQVVVNSDLRSRFSVSMRDMSDGVRIVVYSASGKTLPVGDHELFTIAQPNYALCTMNCELSDVRLTDAQARRLPVTILDATAAVPSVVSESKQTEEVFDLSGRPVGPWHTLPSGIYVIKVNGKQYKVKK